MRWSAMLVLILLPGCCCREAACDPSPAAPPRAERTAAPAATHAADHAGDTAQSTERPAAEKPWTPWRYLFDGTSLTSWEPTGNPEAWGAEEGGILAIKLPGEGHLRSVARHGDFDLKCEFRLDAGADTGFFFGAGDAADPAASGFEIQLTNVGPPVPGLRSLGALAGKKAPDELVGILPGNWNRLLVEVRQRHVRVEIQGKQVLDADLSPWLSPAEVRDSGWIGFLNQRFPAWYREILIREPAR